jgi:16S rRNA (cytosine967-C5)-methyltransferase
MAAHPRQLCIQALTTWQRGRQFADEILDELTARRTLDARDRAWLREAFYGIIRHLAPVDFVIDHLREGALDPSTRAVLRLGIYELFHMRTPAHALVHESVARAARARGLVNAILRRAIRKKDRLDRALAAAPDPVRLSHPGFLIARWTAQFGLVATLALCEWNNRPAPLFVRANGLRLTAGELLRSLPGTAPCTFHEKAVQPPRLPASWLRGGLCYVQDPSTLAACDLLAPQPGEQVLDACAAPGGKTTYLAELMDNRGHIVACDLWKSRLEFLQQNIRRLGIRNTHPMALDLLKPHPALKPRSFDRILLDAPCSNTGVVRRRVDVRWRLTEEDFVRMPEQQFALLRRAAEALKPGGTLVYSTCSLEREENEAVVARFLEAHPAFRCTEQRHILPWRDGVDGAFAARLVLPRLG